MTNAQAAQLALYALYAEDAFAADPISLTPPADPRLKGWTVVGYLTAVDHLFHDGGTVCYGYVAQSTADPTKYLAAVRGTESMIEWIEDAEYALIPHPVAGHVEAGFFGVYASMLYRAVGSAEALPAAQGLTRQIGTGHLQIVGHSLGSALATYLAFDMPAAQIDVALFASPKTGDRDFTAAFHAKVKSYQAWAFLLDVVPRMPPGLEYATLPNVTLIYPGAAQSRIRFSIWCWHHALSCASMLDYSLMNWSEMPVCDRQYGLCILGPNP